MKDGNSVVFGQDPLQDLTVIIPVYGNRKMLITHVQRHASLYTRSGQTVWVATPSPDNAHHVAEEASRRFGGEYHELGPGLYEAWNKGISQTRKAWIYFNTIGDLCDLDSLQNLLKETISTGAEVAFTPPRQGTQDVGLKQWPIFRLAGTLTRWDARIIPRHTMIRLQLLAGDSNLLGSLAGAVFAAHRLRQFPFRNNYKSFGDTAWTYENCASAKFMFSKNSVASFLSHDSLRPSIHPKDTRHLLLLLAKQMADPAKPELHRRITRYLVYRRRLNQLRGIRPKWAWWGSPSAWMIRFLRGRAFSAMTRSFLRAETDF